MIRPLIFTLRAFSLIFAGFAIFMAYCANIRFTPGAGFTIMETVQFWLHFVLMIGTHLGLMFSWAVEA